MFKLFITKWAFLFILIVANLVIGLRTSIEFFYFLFWFLLSITLIGLAWTIAAYFLVRLHLERKTPRKIVDDESLEVEATISNFGFLPVFGLIVEDNLACAVGYEQKRLISLDYIKQHSFVRLRYSCRCPQRGKYRVGPFTAYLFDPLNLFFLKRTYYIYSELYVYPRTFRINRFPNLTKGALPWFGIETSRVSGDEDEFFGTREYKAGDPIKRVHWLSSARKNKLIVKEYQRQSFYRATIMFNLEKDINFGEGKERVCEYMIKIAASTAKYLTERNVSVEIIAHTGELVHIESNKGVSHLEDILKLLAGAQAESRVSLGEIFAEFSRYVKEESNLIIIMSDEDFKYLPAILSLQKRRVSIIPFVVIASTFLNPFENQRITREIKIRLSRSFNFNPKFFSQGDNLEECFLKF